MKISIRFLDLPINPSHFDVYGFNYASLGQAVPAWEIDVLPGTYIDTMMVLLSSPGLQYSQWDYTALDYSLPFALPVPDANTLISKQTPDNVLRLLFPGGQKLMQLPLETHRLHEEFNAAWKTGTAVMPYLYFEADIGKHAENNPIDAPCIDAFLETIRKIK